MKKQISNQNHISFHRYIYDFYNEIDGIFPIKKITHAMINDGIEKYLEQYPDRWGGGDTVDREGVRDIILEDNDVVWTANYIYYGEI